MVDAAEAAYKVAQAKWNAACQDMSVQATKASASLASINDNYANAEYQGLGLWGQ